MTYLRNKISNFQFPISNPRQAGVTLLLAILVLSSILAISFSLATILFIEIRTSGDLVKTEPALYGANGVAEEAIFNVKRKTGVSNYTTQFNNNVQLANAPQETSTNTPIFEADIPAGTSFNTANTYVFYDPLKGSASTDGSNYGKVAVTYLDSGAVQPPPLIIYLCQFNPNDGVDPNGSSGTYNTTACSDPNDTPHSSDAGTNDYYWLDKNDQSLNPNTNPTESWGLDPDLQQELILYNPSNTDIHVKIETYGPESYPGANDNQPMGLPFAGETAVDIHAINGVVGRKLRVIVPNSAGNFNSSAPVDNVWVEDSLPPGAASQQDAFNWISSNPTPFSGSFSDQSLDESGNHQQYFIGANPTFQINAGDIMVAYVYLDPLNPPSEIMLQWNDGSWEHRAYWGADDIGWGTDGTVSRVSMGSLPPLGQWVRLTVPASQVGLEGSSLNGAAFTLYDGMATWDHIGKTSGSTSPTTGTLVLKKNTSGGDGSFSFSATGDSSLASQFPVTLNTSGGSASQTFGNVAVGNYSISENLPSGWSLTSASCNDGSSSYSFPTVSSIQVNAGATVTCTFSDVKVSLNYALSGTAFDSSQIDSRFPIADINDGDRLGNTWGNGTPGGGWNDNGNPPASWAGVDFSGTESINEIDVYTLANCFNQAPSGCTSIDAATPADNYGIQDFQVQYDNGGTWQTVPGGTVTGNTLAWRQFSFPTINTDKIRVYITTARGGYARLVELEAY